MRIHDDDSKEELVPGNIKRYKVIYEGTTAKIKEGIEIANGGADLIGKIIGWFKPFAIN